MQISKKKKKSDKKKSLDMEERKLKDEVIWSLHPWACKVQGRESWRDERGIYDCYKLSLRLSIVNEKGVVPPQMN